MEEKISTTFVFPSCVRADILTDMWNMKCLITIFAHYIANVISETPGKNTTANYDPAELLRKIFNSNETILPRANYGLIQFEDQILQPGFGNFNAQNNLQENSHSNGGSVQFENVPTYESFQSTIKFEDAPGSKKKRRRKRKPKQHYGLQNTGNVPNLPFGPGSYPSYGQYYRPSRPRPSLASEALTAVTGALTSIAMYDDYQCVPRLLCEAAAGGALGSSGILQTVSGLQPLLTLLSAYNGLTSNPLFVFGRAVLLGAAPSSGQAACRYAYPACPTDPEQLVHYLNNHNGGFFRFFNAPQQGQQNVEQFYNQLSQNYGFYQPNQEYNQNGNQQNYGFSNDQANYGYQKPGLYSNYDQNYGTAYPYQNYNQNIRFKNNNFNENANKIEKRIQNKPNTLYIDDSEDEEPKWAFPEKDTVNYVNNDAFNFGSGGNNYNGKILNHDYLNDRNRYRDDNRKGKALKFPGVNNGEDYLESSFDKDRGSFFPAQNNRHNLDYSTSTHNNYDNQYHDIRQHLDYDKPSNNNYDSKYHDNRQYLDYNKPYNNNFDSKYHDNRQYLDYNSINSNNFNNINGNPYNTNNNKYNNDNYVNNNKYDYNNDLQEGVRTVYVVRGNGDPNKPEVYRLRPGQTVQ